MKIAKRTDYALRTVLELSAYNGRLISASDIARRRKIPLKFLEQILGTLKRSGIVKSERGQKGGYVLAKDASKLSLAEVVRVFEGEAFGLQSADELIDSRAGSSPALIEIWSELGQYMTERLEQVTFEELSAKDKMTRTEDPHNFVI